MTDAQAKTIKTPKKKGPLRWEAIIPAAIFMVLVAAYMHLFFDNHLRRVLEFGATRAHGAEVNIGSLKLSFLKASLNIENIEVTNKTQPELNLIQVGAVRFELVGDALLRAKAVVETADILDIQVNSPRRRPGRVLPPSPPSPALTDEAKDIALTQLKKDNESNLLGNVAQLLGGVKPEDQLKDMEANLGSLKKIQELDRVYKDKESQWKERVANLPKDEDLKTFETRFNAIKKDRFADIGELQTSLKALDALYKEAREEVKSIESAGKDFERDFKSMGGELKAVEGLIQQDIQDLKNRLQIPSLDADGISQALFSGLILSRLTTIFNYVEKAQEYIPTKKKQETPITPRERQTGRDYQFPITSRGYPRFWLKSSTISSKSQEGDHYGDFTGRLTNVTDNPPFVGKPAVLDLQGDVPGHGIRGLKALITVDHTQEPGNQSFDVQVAEFPVSQQILSDSEKVRLGFEKALGQSKIQGQFSRGKFGFDLNTEFSNMNYIVEADSSSLKQILERAVGSIPMLDLRARVDFDNGKLGLRIRSNLGREIEQAIRNEVDLQVKRAQAEIEKFVQGKVAQEKAKLEQLLSKVEKDIGLPLRKKEETLDEAQKKVDQAQKNVVNQQKKQAEDRLKKEGENLLRGLGF